MKGSDIRSKRGKAETTNKAVDNLFVAILQI